MTEAPTVKLEAGGELTIFGMGRLFLTGNFSEDFTYFLALTNEESDLWITATVTPKDIASIADLLYSYLKTIEQDRQDSLNAAKPGG